MPTIPRMAKQIYYELHVILALMMKVLQSTQGITIFDKIKNKIIREISNTRCENMDKQQAYRQNETR